MIVTARIKTEYSRACEECGADCSFCLEEDDTHERLEGGSNPKFIPNRGLRLENSVFYCTNCGARYA